MRRFLLLLALGLLGEPLAAQTAVPAPRVSKEVRALHEGLLTLDTHLDTPANLVLGGWNISERHDRERDGSQVDLPRMVQGGLDGGFWAIFTPQGPRTRAGENAARDAALLRAVAIREMVVAHSSQFELALK